MASSLRKGHSSVYLQYEHVGESMGAEKFETESNNGTLIFRFRINPVDSNQRDDEAHLHEYKLQSITVYDDHIITKFINFIKNKHASEFRVEIVSQGKCLEFSIAEGPSQLNGLTFQIENEVS